MKGAFLSFFCRTGDVDCSWLIYFFLLMAFLFMLGSPIVAYISVRDYLHSKRNKKTDLKQKKKEMIYLCLVGLPIGGYGGYYLFFTILNKIFK